MWEYSLAKMENEDRTVEWSGLPERKETVGTRSILRRYGKEERDKIREEPVSTKKIETTPLRGLVLGVRRKRPCAHTQE